MEYEVQSVCDNAMEDDLLASSVQEQVPAFLQKLWAMVCDSNTNHLISWSEKGNSFIVKNAEALARDVLPKYFKHRNFSSFVRQLNLYNFIRSSGLGTNAIIASGNVEFGHMNFCRNRPELMIAIKRKNTTLGSSKTSPTAAAAALPIQSSAQDDFSKSVIGSLEKLQQQQEHIMGTLQDINRDNRALWTELVSLRQSVQRHDVIIDKLVKFIAQLFKGRAILGQKRKRFAFDLADALEAPAKRSSSGAVAPPVDPAAQLLDDLLAAVKNGTVTSAITTPGGLFSSGFPDSLLTSDDVGAAGVGAAPTGRDVVAYTGSRAVQPGHGSIVPLTSGTGSKLDAIPFTSGSATVNEPTSVATDVRNAGAAPAASLPAITRGELPCTSSSSSRGNVGESLYPDSSIDGDGLLGEAYFPDGLLSVNQFGAVSAEPQTGPSPLQLPGAGTTGSPIPLKPTEGGSGTVDVFRSANAATELPGEPMISLLQSPNTLDSSVGGEVCLNSGIGGSPQLPLTPTVDLSSVLASHAVHGEALQEVAENVSNVEGDINDLLRQLAANGLTTEFEQYLHNDHFDASARSLDDLLDDDDDDISTRSASM